MLRYALILLLLLFTIGCSTTSNKSIDIPNNRKNYINPLILRYVIDYENTFNTKVDMYIGFESNLDSTEVGQCWKFSSQDGSYREVVIEREWWEDEPILKRRAIVFHELGHCIHNLKHIIGKLSDECPKSLMNDYLPSQKCLRTHWDYYMTEMKFCIINNCR